MKKDNGDFRNQIITIKNSKINVNELISSIKDTIKKKRVKYLLQLNSKIPSFIDTAENGEFLLEGWHEVGSIGGTRARWTLGEFSFLFNPEDIGILTFRVVSYVHNFKGDKLTLKLLVKGKVIDIYEVDNENKKIINFKLPDNLLNKNNTFTVKLSSIYSPAELGINSDTRLLGLAIKEISNLPFTEIGLKYIPKLSEFEYISPLEIEKIKYHINPSNLLPQKTKFKFIKKSLLRLMNVFTSVQVGFNTYTVNYFQKLGDYLLNLSGYVKGLDNKINVLEKKTGSNNLQKYVYWDQYKEKLYQFHQDFFRGDYKTISERLKVYIPYLKNIEKGNKMVDFGCGRGELLKIIMDLKIKVTGVDNNSEVVRDLKEKGLNAVCDDAIAYLTSNNDKLAGVSAIHLLEHLSFPIIFDFLKLAYNKLDDGGLLILETPNVENLNVASFTFYYDFTHRQKLPPLLLTKTLEFIGFNDIKVLLLHPEENPDVIKGTSQICQDYAVIAYK